MFCLAFETGFSVMDNSDVMNNGKKEYTITWFIENYSYCWQERMYSLASPIFIAHSFEDIGSIQLKIYPRGNSLADKGSISLDLEARKSGGDLPKKYELAVLAADEKSVLHSVEREYTWLQSFGFGVTEFLRMDEVLLRQKASYLHQDTLILRCRMWKDQENVPKLEHCCARTRIGTEKISFLHKVKNFSALEPNKKNTFQVESHSNTGCIISSSIYFIDAWSAERMIFVEIEPSDKNYILRKLKLSLIDLSGNVVECRQVDNRFDDTVVDIQKISFSLARKIILNRSGEYLPNDELSLICECTFSTGVEFQKIEEIQHELPLASLKQNSSNPSNKYGYNSLEKLSACSSALNDLKTIYNNQHLTDIELKTETKSFPAHKLVLCARSPVFNAMLTNDMKEKNADFIQVDDLENDTVQQLLMFLYSDNLENLQWESAVKLYYAGDKYDIEKLKVLCSAFFVENISTTSASELLLLADTHNDSDLKKFVEDFILKHEDDVFGSDEWEKLIDTNPQLVIKTMHLKYKRKKEGIDTT